MSTFTSFAVIGAGVIGTPIVEALLAVNASVVVVTRPSSSTPKQLPNGARSASADYTDVPALATIFREANVQVIVSTVAEVAVPVQRHIADAGKEAGVKLFVPSEFGLPTVGNSKGLWGHKTQLHAHLESIGLPYSLLYTGMFIDQVPWATGLQDNGKINIVGKGDVPISWTAISDIAGFVAHVLTVLPLSRLSNTVLRIQGVRATLLDVAALYPTKPIVHVDAFPSDIPGHEIRTILLKKLEGGSGSTGWDVIEGRDAGNAGSANELWEGHVWKGFKDVLAV